MLSPQDRLPQGEGPLMDYVLQPYPDKGPRGLHSVCVLRHYLRQRGWFEALWPVLEACQALLGPSMTVWGVKEPASIELYFYNHGDRARMSVARLVAALHHLVPIDSQVRADQDYLMCSLELRGASTDGFRIYVAGGPSSQTADGTSYRVQGRTLELENLYWFHPPSQLDRIIRHLKRSVRTHGRARQLLPREYLDCHSVCYATKRHSDALYFSRLDTPTTALFLDRHWPGFMAELFAEHAADFAHLAWDVGYDFSEGQPAKVGLYGFL